MLLLMTASGARGGMGRACLIRQRRRRRRWRRWRLFKTLSGHIFYVATPMEESASRTARLQALRAAKERRAQANPDAASTGEAAASDAAAATGPKVIFRNYQPTDKSLQETSKLPRAGVVKPAIAAKVADDDNVLNVIAKKANWDLKRDLQPKLQKLERRTEVPHNLSNGFPLSTALAALLSHFFYQKAIRDIFREQEKARTAQEAAGN
jgi:coiled-coil domain-containing protein 12